MAKQFKDIIEVLNDKQTRKFILEEIQTAFEKRSEIDEKIREQFPQIIADDIKVKTTPWERLQEKGLLQLPDIGYEFIRIKNKSSELPTSERKIIDALIRTAIGRTIKHYNLKK